MARPCTLPTRGAKKLGTTKSRSRCGEQIAQVLASQGNNMVVIDIASGKVFATVTTGPGAHGVVVDSSGKTAFVTNIDAGTVSAIDTNTQQVTSTFKVGAGPNGISYRRK